MIIPEADYFIYYDVFPWSVRGLVKTNNDGTFSIYLNRRYPISVLKKTFQHEIKHIEFDDFHNNKSIQEIENL